MDELLCASEAEAFLPSASALLATYLRWQLRDSSWNVSELAMRCASTWTNDWKRDLVQKWSKTQHQSMKHVCRVCTFLKTVACAAKLQVQAALLKELLPQGAQAPGEILESAWSSAICHQLKEQTCSRKRSVVTCEYFFDSTRISGATMKCKFSFPSRTKFDQKKALIWFNEVQFCLDHLS